MIKLSDNREKGARVSLREGGGQSPRSAESKPIIMQNGNLSKTNLTDINNSLYCLGAQGRIH